jgi:hypothetical protein
MTYLKEKFISAKNFLYYGDNLLQQRLNDAIIADRHTY